MKAQALAELVRDLARLYVGTPASIEVKFQQAADGPVYFAMKGDRTDDSRLVGREGCHVDALAYLIEAIGKRESRVFTFRLITDPDRAEPWQGPRDALEYDPRPAREVLCRWLEALGVEKFSVEVGPGDGARTSLSYNFNVKIPDREKAESLTKSTEGDLSIVGALGTLFRAVSKQAGVRFQIRLADRATS